MNENQTQLTIRERAEIAVQSGFFGIKNAAQAAALLMISQDEGIPPSRALSEYHVMTNGRPALKSEAILARFQQAGGTIRWIKRTRTECAAVFTHPQGGELEVEWTIEDAKLAGLLTNQNWSKYPRHQLSARVVTEGVRAVYPACLGGVACDVEVEALPAQPSKRSGYAQQRESVVEAEVITDAQRWASWGLPAESMPEASEAIEDDAATMLLAVIADLEQKCGSVDYAKLAAFIGFQAQPESARDELMQSHPDVLCKVVQALQRKLGKK